MQPEHVDSPVEIALRIPGRWPDAAAFDAALPDGWSWRDGRMVGPEGIEADCIPRPADDEFVALFAAGCAREPSDRDKRIVEGYTVNVCLAAPGGSVAATMRILAAAVAVLDAGGGGVFVDNSGVAHGSDDWRDLAADPSGGGAFWAMVATVGSPDEIYSIGMHTLGHPDAVMPRTGDDEFDHFYLNNFLGYLMNSGRVMHNGDVVGDPKQAHFGVHREPAPPPAMPGHPMHNPFGRWRLAPMDPADN